MDCFPFCNRYSEEFALSWLNFHQCIESGFAAAAVYRAQPAKPALSAE
jgi:hypothetical protein